MAGVDEPVQEGLGDDGVGEEGIPVAGRPVAGDDQRASLPLGDEFVEVVGLGADSWRMAKSSRMRTSGRTSSRTRFSHVRSAWPPARSARMRLVLAKADVGALADGEVAEGLGDVGLADADGAEEDDRFAGVEPA